MTSAGREAEEGSVHDRSGSKPPLISDERMDAIMASVLRGGVVLAAAVVLVGGAFYLARYGVELPHYRTFRGEPEHLRSIGGIVREAFSGSGRGIIQLGLLLLIATPIARVTFALVAFALQRDRLYVVVSAIVLGALMFGVFGGQ